MSDHTTAPGNRLAGFRKWEGTDPFEDNSGPFFYRDMGDGRFLGAFEATGRHMNASGAIHGGCLMTFADFSLFIFAKPALDTVSAVTISFASEFLDAGFAGDLVLAEGHMTRETGSLIFARGTIYAERDMGQAPLLTYSGVLKKIRNPG